ncbi:uncharacterized protein METZ01_LOCUS18193 [marine metagenome]|uniref:Uncharacterized protein n=1 Tax=marine metagenome TaxID=408172 RepID=A0A381PGV2_9ZZZZ
MATNDPASGDGSAPQGTVSLDGVDRVLRTGWIETTNRGPAARKEPICADPS